jgi:hypothetical protein
MRCSAFLPLVIIKFCMRSINVTASSSSAPISRSHADPAPAMTSA